jgi:hypothetical protein
MTPRAGAALILLMLGVPGCKCGRSEDTAPRPAATTSEAPERAGVVTCAAKQPGRLAILAKLEEGSTNGVSHVAVDATHVYFLMGSEERPLQLRRASKAGGKIETLWPGWGARRGPRQQIVVSGDAVYFLAGHERTSVPALYRVAKEGSDTKVLFTDPDMYGFAVQADSAYVVLKPASSPADGGAPAPQAPRLLRVPLGGSAPVTLATFAVGSSPGAPAVDESGVYLPAGEYVPGQRVIYRVPKQGGEPESVTTEGQARDWGMLLEKDTVFFVGESNDYWRVPKRGGVARMLLPGPFVTAGVLEGDALYAIWAPDFDAATHGGPLGTGIRRVSTQAGAPTVVLPRDPKRAFGSIAVDDRCIYFVRAVGYGERELVALGR